VSEFGSPETNFERAGTNSRFLKLGSTILAENSFTWIVGLTGSALIPVRSRSMYRERLTYSGVEVKPVTAFASES
jgi:hypothetical protein